MDALTLLIGDHNRVRGLFSRFRDAEESDDVEGMTSLASAIFDELKVHTTIEEDVFYPTVRDADDDIAELVAEGVEEHHVVDRLMAEIEGLEAGAEQWVAKMKVLMENVEHHAEEEEGEMFPKVRSNVDGLDRLGDRLNTRKRELGAPTIEATIDLTKTELLDKAKQQEIPGRSKMSQEELAAAVDPR